MDRPVRRSRQRFLQSAGLIGLLPQEEAAINRALHESLLKEKKKTPTTKHQQSITEIAHCSSDSVSHDSTHAIRHISDNTGHTSSVDDHLIIEGCTSSKRLGKRRRLYSPISPSHSLDSLSSDNSKASSPLRGNTVGVGTSSSSVSSPPSVESSLKLVLSTSASWSRSSSSSWSPTPEPVTMATNTSGTTGTSKTLPSKLNKAQPKLKSMTEKPGETKVKGKRGRPRKYPLNETKKTNTKTGKVTAKVLSSFKPKPSKTFAPKTYTKASLQFHGALSSKKKQIKITSKKKLKAKNRQMERNCDLDIPPLSPEAALVLHDHSYSGSPIHRYKPNDAKSNSIRSSPYSVQRKFAQNQVPIYSPTRPIPDELESVSGPKEIPKTEDFINFLCLRRSDSMPKEFEKFSFPWTQLRRKRSKNGNDITTLKRKVLTSSASKGSNKSKSRNVAKKLGESISRSIPLHL